jgi:cysteinyl-tRNA synthetase
MSMATLLEPFGGGLQCDDPSRNTFDIHGGGIDLVFPHHENEIAQSCTAFHSSRMANVWMHNGFLQVEGEKMSKSLGNFVTIHELLRTTNFGGRKWSGEVLRLAMLRAHYRQPIDWTVKALEEAEATLDRWYEAVGDVETDDEVAPGVLDALSDDLNTPAAIAGLHQLAKTGELIALRASLRFLGFSCDPAKSMRFLIIGELSVPVAGTASTALAGTVGVTAGATGQSTVQGIVRWFQSETDGTFSADPTTQNLIDELVGRRNAARAAKNFAEADRLRDEIASLGIALKDNKDGTTTWEPKR